MRILLVIVCVLFSCATFGQKKATKPTSANKTTAAKAGGAASVAKADVPGKMVYQQYCLSCHQADGSGVPGLNPPLRKTEWVLGDKTKLINVLLKGLQSAEVEGEMYDNVMPAHEFLSDQQIADVLTYVRMNFGNQATAITPDEVKQARSLK